MSHPEIAVRSSTSEPVIVRFSIAGEGKHKRPDAVKETRDLHPAVSLDNGQSWALGESAVPACYKKMRRCIYMTETSRGTFRYAPYNYPERTLRFDSYWEYPDGSASSMGKSRIVLPFRQEGEMRTMDQGVELADGSIMLVAYGKSASSKGNTGYYVFTLISTNNGATFEYGVPVATHDQCQPSIFGPNEAALLRCDNGDLICVMRTGSTVQWGADPIKDMYSMLIARSKDEGNTWEVKSMGLPGVNPRMLRMENGVIVLAYGRPGNNLIFSKNDGLSWGSEITLTPADARSTGYIGMTALDSNKLFVAYDTFNTDLSRLWLWEPEEVNGIFGQIIEVNGGK